MAKPKYAKLTADLVKRAVPASFIGPDGRVEGFAIVDRLPAIRRSS
jgi:hypothetical protein